MGPLEVVLGEMHVDAFLEGAGSSSPLFRPRLVFGQTLTYPIVDVRSSLSLGVEEVLEVKAVQEAESSSVKNARAVKAILQSVYPRWRALLEDHEQESPRTCGLERFECGMTERSS